MLPLEGVTFRHAVVAGNLRFKVRQLLPADAYSVHRSGLKVRTPRAFAYPDAFIISGAPALLDEHRDVVTNPVAIFEVFSETSFNHDMGRKFVEYRKLPSLQHFVLIDQDRVHVEHWAKQGENSWLLRELEAGDPLRLPDLLLEIPIDVLYENAATSEDDPA